VTGKTRAVAVSFGVLAVAAASLQLAAFLLPDGAGAFATRGAWMLAGSAALGAMVAAGVGVEGTPQRRGGWLFAAAAAAWLAGSSVRLGWALGAPAELSHVADGLWVGYAVLCAIAVVVRAPRGLLSFRLFLLDAAPIVLLAAAVALSATRAGHTVSSPRAAAICLFALYVVPPAITLQMMALDGLRRATSAWWFLALGWVVLAAAALTWQPFTRSAAGGHLSPWVGTLWTAGMILVTASGIQRARDPVRGYFSNTERESSRRAVPAALATFALLVFATVERAHLATAVLALLAFVAFALRAAIARHRMGGIVDDLVRSREALSDSEHRFRSIFESTAIGVSVWGLDGRIVEANQALEEMLGYGPGELAGRSFMELAHPDDSDETSELIEQLVRRERRSFQFERRYVRRDGETVWGRVTSSLIRDTGSAELFVISAVENIDARRRAEASVAAAEARYRTLVEQLPFVTYIADLDSTAATYVSPQIEALLGYSTEEWTTQPDFYSHVLHPDDRDRVLAAYAEMRRRGDACETEYRLVARDGRDVWIRDAAVVVRDASNRPLHVQGHMIDINKQRRAEEAIARNREILESVAAVSETLLAATSWEEVADTVLQMLGEAAGVSRAYIFENQTAWDGRDLSYQRYEWVADGIDAFLDDELMQGFDLGEAHERMKRVLGSGGVVAETISSLSRGERNELERQGIRSILLVPIMAGGRWWGWLGLDECTTDRVWAEGEIDAMRTAAGTLAAAIQREHAEETEREAVQTLQAVVEASPAAIVGLDRAGSVIIWNPAAEAMFGWRAYEVLGRPNPNVPDEGQEEYQGLLDRGISGESWSDLEVIWRRKDGSQLHVSSSAAPLRNGAGEIVGAVAVLVDIDERKAAERERERLLNAERVAHIEAEAARKQLADQNERLRELDALKDEFVALVSHELRTPLTSILGYLDLALDPLEGTLSDEQREFLDVVHRNSRRLLHLVGDLLFLAQADAGKLSFERAPIDLAAIAQECIDVARPSAMEKEIELILDAQPVALYQGDRMRLAQLLDNLVSNAVKFTPSRGRVRVGIEQEGHAIVVSVADTGIGVSKEEQARLFERFFRTTTATRDAIQGTGLGLAITKTIVEGHGGQITLTSEEGVGTTFRVELPLPLAMAA
jgi:PAS domain S-box-containing protein